MAWKGGYRLSSNAIYMLERRGVAVNSRSSTEAKAKRLAQVVRLGVTGRKTVSRVNSHVTAIQDKGYSRNFTVL